MAQSDRVCVRLKQAREAQSISKRHIADRLKMSEKHIDALESCRFDELPFAPVYQKKLIKNYLRLLNIDDQSLVEQFVNDELPAIDPQPLESPVKTRFCINIPVVMRVLAAIGLVGAIAAYLGIQIHNIVREPELSIFSPTDNETTEEQQLVIQGKTEPDAQVRINGQQVRNDEQGFFEATVSLSPGLNTIVTISQKKHSQAREIVRHITYQETQTMPVIRTIERE